MKQKPNCSPVDAQNLDSLKEAAQWFLSKGVKNVIITLGSKGAFLSGDEGGKIIAAPSVMPVDTTAAGDVFNGALTVALAENKPLPKAVDFACKAAALSVTRMGAKTWARTRKEVEVSYRYPDKMKYCM